MAGAGGGAKIIAKVGGAVAEKNNFGSATLIRMYGTV